MTNRSGREQMLPAATRLSRRRLLGWGLAVGAALAGEAVTLPSAPRPVQAQAVQQPAGSSLPITGQPVSQLAAFDDVMQQVMAQWGLPGGALALAKDGRLVFSHAYGLADPEANLPFQPSSLCRIASDSKPFTAVTILRLLDAGKLSLDDKAFRIL